MPNRIRTINSLSIDDTWVNSCLQPHQQCSEGDSAEIISSKNNISLTTTTTSNPEYIEQLYIRKKIISIIYKFQFSFPLVMLLFCSLFQVQCLVWWFCALQTQNTGMILNSQSSFPSVNSLLILSLNSWNVFH